jgi:acyl carrier protein
MSRPTQAEIEDAIKRNLMADLAVDPLFLAAIDVHTPLLGHGIALDSVETVGLALGLEQAFDIQIPDGDLTEEMFENLGALVDYITRRVGQDQGDTAKRAPR